MTNSVFYKLYSSTWDVPSLLDEAYAAARATWLCKECDTIKLPPATLDIQVNKKRIFKPINFVDHTRIGLVHEELLRDLDEEIVARDLLLGSVFGPDKKRVEGWNTFRGRYRILIRGTSEASRSICASCGEIVYFASGTKEIHGLPSVEAEIYESQFADLILSERLFKRIDRKKWRKLQAEQIECVSEPSDGFGEISLKKFE